MDEERQMILRMLKEGKVSVEEADALLRALEEEDGETGAHASIDAAVLTGRISSTLSLAQVTSDRRSLWGILNEAGAKVALRTVSGNIDTDGREA